MEGLYRTKVNKTREILTNGRNVRIIPPLKREGKRIRRGNGNKVAFIVDSAEGAA
jgi:hypothetical protein